MMLAYLLCATFLIVGITGAYSASVMRSQAETVMGRFDWLVVIVLNVVVALTGFLAMVVLGCDTKDDE